MPENKEAIIFQLEADDSGVKRKIANVESTARSTADSIGFSMSSMAKKVAGAMAIAFSVDKIVSFGKSCLSLGSDLAEVQNVVNVTFQTMSGDIDKFAKNAAKQFGLSETAAKKYAGTYGSMAEAFGFTEKQALSMSEALTGLTGDVASFYNLDSDTAYTKLKSVFSGETESLKDLGVVMTQDALNAYALARGYGKTVSEMSEMEKVSLRYAFVSEKLANAQGDYARTSDGWANSTRTLALQFDSLKAELGQGLINVFLPIVSWLNIIIERLTAAATKFREFTASIMGVKNDSDHSALSAIASTELLNNGLEKTESTAKKAAKAMRDLMGFDEINRLSSNDTSSGSDSASSAAVPDIAASAAVPSDTESTHKIRFEIFDKPLKRIKELWGKLKKSFLEGLKIRLDAGEAEDKLKNIWENIKQISKTLSDIFQNPEVSAAAGSMLTQISEYLGSHIGNIISVGTSIAEALTQGISDFLEEKKDFLQEKMTSVFQTTGDVFGSLTDIESDITDIISYILGLDSTAKVISDTINILVTPALSALDLMLQYVRDNLKGMSEVLSANKDGFMKIGEDIVGFISDVTGAVSGFVDTVCAKAESVYTQYIKPAIDNIWSGINDLVTFLVGIWQQYISPLLDDFGADIKELFQDHIAPMAEKAMEFCGKLFHALSQLWKNVLEPIVEWIIAYAMPKIKFVVTVIWKALKTAIANIADIIGFVMDYLSGLIDFLTGVFFGDWKKAWNGIKEMFGAWVDLIKNLLGNFKDYASDILTAIQTFASEQMEAFKQYISTWFSAVRKIVENAVKFVKDAAKQIFDTIISFAADFGVKIHEKMTEIWNKITGVFSNVKGFFKEKFEAAANGIKEAFGGIYQWFSNLFCGLVDILKAPVNAIIDMMNLLIDNLNGLSIDIPDWVPGIGGNTVGFNIPEIPHLATGGYVRANTPQLAVIGDNRREGEIVAPESKIAEAVAAAMQMVLSRIGGIDSGGQQQGDMILQANIWLGNELLAKKLTKLQKVNDYRSGGLA